MASATAQTADKRPVQPLRSTEFGPLTSSKTQAKQPSFAASTSVLAAGRTCSRSMIARPRSSLAPYRKPPLLSYRAMSFGLSAGNRGYGRSKVPCSTRKTESEAITRARLPRALARRGTACGLTPPSSGRFKGRFASFGPPLMSNVGPQRSESWRASKSGSSMHAGLSVLRRPADRWIQSSALAAYFAEVFGSRRYPMGCPSFGGQRAVSLTG